VARMTLKKIEKAMREVRDRLRDGRIREEQFNMDVALDRDTPCGTVGCIGGWALVSMYGLDKADTMYISEELVRPLYGYGLPDRAWALWRLFYCFKPNATPAQAADAIDRWLDGSDDPWRR
jgi:hypothetical protein